LTFNNSVMDQSVGLDNMQKDKNKNKNKKKNEKRNVHGTFEN